MKKKSLIFVICMLFVLSGCNGPKAEILEMTETRQIMVKKLTLPSEEYSNIIQRNADGRRKGKIYSFIKDDVSDEAYTVFEFRMFDYPVEFEWFGDISIGDKFYDDDDTIVLGDSTENRRLYFRGIRITREEILGCKEEDWKAMVGHSLKSKKEFFEKTEETDGLKVLCEVENEDWSGYVAFLYEYATERLFEVVYIEHNEIYNNDQALEMIRSVNHVDTQVEQVVFELTSECGDPIELYAGDIFNGNLLRLAEIFAYAKNEIVVGKNDLLFSDGAHVYTVTLNIVDTLPPEITYKGEKDEVRYFLPGEELNARELGDLFFEASDRSGAVNINFADGRERLIISEEEFGGEIPKEVTLQVSDASGNTQEAVVYPTILEEERIPEWYSVFFEGKLEMSPARKLVKILSDTSYKPEQYLDVWYEAGGIRTQITNESMENALSGHRRLEEMEFEVVVSEDVLPEGEVLFYANMNLVPEEILQKYVENGQEYVLDAKELTEHQSAYIAQEFAENATKGVQKAEEVEITFGITGTMDALSLMDIYAVIGENAENKNFISFVTTYDDNMTESETVNFLTTLDENKEALDGYVRLKNVGIDVKITGEECAKDIITWFEDANRFPEELVRVYVDNNWDVTVPEGDLSLYLKDNSFIFRDNLAEKAVEGYYAVKDMGLELVFEPMTFLELARFYENLYIIPEEIWQMCVEKDVKVYASLDWLYHYNKYDSKLWEAVLCSYERLESLGIDVNFRGDMNLNLPLYFYQVMADIPEDFVKLYAKNDWEIPVSEDEGRSYVEALHYMDEEIYEKARNGYNKLQKHKIKVKYLDVWQPPELIMFYAGIDCLPEYVLKDYVKQGWKLILSDANLKKKYDTEIEAAGVTVYGEKLIEVVSCDDLSYIDNTVIHEMGHYVDFSDWENTWKCYSEDESRFKSLYRRIEKKEQGGKEWQADSEDLLRELTSLYYDPYSFTAEGEFFADSYFFYVLYPEELKAKYPEVYAYIDECSKTLQ